MGDINQFVEQQKVVNQYLEEKKTATDLFVKENKGKWGMADDVDQRMAERDRLSQKDIALILEQRASVETNESKELKKAKPLFSKSKDEQSRGRFSKLKKAQRKKAAKDIALVDQEKKEMVDYLAQKGELFSDPSYADYISKMSKAQEIKSERVDVTGYERRSRASKNVLGKESVMKKDVDHLVHNMMKDLCLSGEYEPAKEFQEYRSVQKLIPSMEEQLDVWQKHVEMLEERRKEFLEDGTWTDANEKLLKETKLKEIKTRMFIQHVKTMATDVAVEVEMNRTRLKAMEMAREQLGEDNRFFHSVYTDGLIEILDNRIREQKEKISILLKTTLTEGEVIKGNECLGGLNKGIHRMANQVSLWEFHLRLSDFRKENGNEDEFRYERQTARDILDQASEMVGQLDFVLDQKNARAYENYLSQLDKTKRKRK